MKTEMKPHLTHLGLLCSENEFDVLKSDYFLDNDCDSRQIQAIFECFDDPKIFSVLIGENRQLFLPLIFHYKELFYDNLPTSIVNSTRQKYLNDFYDLMKKKRFEELCLEKMKRCLEKCQIEMFKKMCQHLVIKNSPTSKMVEGCLKLKSNLERIEKMHREGHDSNSNKIAQFDCEEDISWTVPTLIAANLDSAHNSKVLEELKKSLEFNYRMVII